MTTEVSSPSRSRFAPTVLPWLVAVAAFIIYLATLNHWLTLNSTTLTAKVAGWDWQPMLAQPALFLATFPCRWLPTNWVPLALNAGAAVCAALTLALLARSVSLLPHDRIAEQKRLANNPHSFLLPPGAWVPPVLATVACGLQITFWENAVSATGEMLDLLLFAYIVRCLLEYRLEHKQSWLDRATLVCGLAMANNWAMVCFLPLFVIAVFWVSLSQFFTRFEEDGETFVFIAPHFLKPGVLWHLGRFVLRLSLLGLAGLSLFLLLPLLQALSGDPTASFGHALRAEAKYYISVIRFLTWWFFTAHRAAGLLLTLTSLLPVLILSIRWRRFSEQGSEDPFRQTNLIIGISHAILMLVCLWAAFDPFFSPRQISLRMGLALSFLPFYFLPFYFLGALSIGYYSGFFLVMCRARPAQSVVWRQRLQQALQKVTPKLVYCLAAVAAIGLLYKNLPVVRALNEPYLRQYGELAAQSLPPEGGIVFSENPLRLLVLQAALASQGKLDRYVPVDVDSLVLPPYQKRLHRDYPQRWPEPSTPPPPASPSVAPPKTNPREFLADRVQLVTRLLQTNQVCYLHPASGGLFEQFYLEPRGLVYDMRRYPTNRFNAPPLSPTALTNNEAFWNRTIETAAGPLQALIAGFESPRHGLRKQLLNSALLEMPVPLQLKTLAQWYAGGLNAWGVTLQRHGQLREASRCFELAQGLNADNRTALVNFQCNSNLLAGKKLTVDQSASLEDLNPRRLTSSQQVAEDGPVDDPSFCFQLGLVSKTNRLFRQALQQFDRVRTLVPSDLAARMNLGGLWNLGGMSGQALNVLAEIRADPTLQPFTPVAEKELTFLEAEAWFNALTAIHQHLKGNPEDVSALVSEGLIFIRWGACSNAIPPLTRALALTNSPIALLYRANAYLGVDNLDASQTDYLKLRQAWPRDCRVFYGLGEVAYRRKDTNAAIGYYQSYLANADAETEEARFVAGRLKALR